MADRKAVNKYYPPDWRPEHGSINKYHGTHALRERARKLDQGILIIRFEMPYNIWCEGCSNHIGMGVRYNAEKKKVGMYYTTPIYQFRMKCHLCNNHFEMKTDPQNLDYIVVCGARRQERRWDPTENEQVAPDDKEVSKKLFTDPMFRLEHGVNDQAKSKTAAPSLARLENLQNRWKDDYVANRQLRQNFRDQRKERQKKVIDDKALLVKSSLNISLVEEDPQDVHLAGLLKLTATDGFEEKQKQKREEILTRPIFSSATLSSTISATKSPAASSLLKHVGQKSKFGSTTPQSKLLPKSDKPPIIIIERSKSEGAEKLTISSKSGISCTKDRDERVEIQTVIDRCSKEELPRIDMDAPASSLKSLVFSEYGQSDSDSS